MKLNNNELIDSAFHQSFNKVCYNHHIKTHQASIVVKIIDNTNLEIHLCQKDVSVLQIEPSELLCGKFIGLRISALYFEKMMRVIHYTFMKDLNLQNPLSIYLLVYRSKYAGSYCIGVIVDKKPVSVLPISDILKLMEHPFELLN
ncbi:MAG: hypothetical protein A3D31_11285 [Candidatus Fluviicola riflensis]|nr:MAG: hypothetical protein CHH17_15710 [Candidatus Fluviicola riflensis]OGS77572.1 MAG: hypothetical protein A3D31_11285 [Candidatus Fluviicola riflensis]